MSDIERVYWNHLPESVRKLQLKLADMPLVPNNPRLRKKRDKLASELMDEARKHHCVADVNLLAGTITDQRVVGQFAPALLHVGAGIIAHPLDQLFLVHDPQRRQTGSAGGGMARIGVAVEELAGLVHHRPGDPVRD